MLDDDARVRRLRDEPRTDRSLDERMHRFCEALQTRLCQAFERLDGTARFSQEAWVWTGGGGGIARVMEGGAVVARSAVRVAAVHGVLPAWTARRLSVAVQPFAATGLTLAVRAVNPYVPAVHAGFHYVRLGEDPVAAADGWFGGGAVLTGVYPFREDTEAFDRVWKALCERHPGVADYVRFEAWRDERFPLPHGQDAQSAGGFFFDGLRDDPEGTFHFIREAGRALLSAYVPLVERRRAMPWRAAASEQLERGRYAERDRLFDPGTPEAEVMRFFPPPGPGAA